MAKRDNNSLSYKDKFRLTELVMKEYASSKMSDAAFAEHAGKVLGITVSVSNVYYSRSAMGVAATKSLTPNKATLEARIGQLEELVLAQSVRIDDCIRKVEVLQHDLRLAAPKLR